MLPFMSHSHGPSCSHHHAPTSFHGAFALGIGLNSLFIIAELAAGYYADSLALIADAAHNLGDVLGLLVAWLGYYLAQKKPTLRFTAGLGRMSIYTTILNGLFLMAAAGWIIIESIERLNAPTTPMTSTVVVVALIGVVINLGTAFLFMRGQHDINIRGAMLHMLGDAGISVAVALSAVVIHYTGWLLIDPILSLLVAVAILWSCWPLLREGAILAMDGHPSNLKTKEIEQFISEFPDVQAVHDLRIWALSTTKIALSAHIEVAPQAEDPRLTLLPTLHQSLRDKFGLASVTLQIEAEGMPCEAIIPHIHRH